MNNLSLAICTVICIILFGFHFNRIEYYRLLKLENNIHNKQQDIEILKLEKLVKELLIKVEKKYFVKTTMKDIIKNERIIKTYENREIQRNLKSKHLY